MERIKLLVKGFANNLFFGSILFVCAGRLNYKQGWIFFAVNVISTLMNFIAIGRNSELIKERSNVGEGSKSWDKKILGLSAIIYCIIIIISGLDSGRFLWTPNFNLGVSISGVIVLITGQALFLVARSQNNFFSTVVRIQKERGHVVCDTGLYKIIRHPGYLGMILSLAAVPMITTSFWSGIPTFIAIILVLIRTSLEDNTLKTELDGYAEYSLKTRYRLIPYIW
jgi:protein-S-isoprenylcysteine O-methyltransferase Ste14